MFQSGATARVAAKSMLRARDVAVVRETGGRIAAANSCGRAAGNRIKAAPDRVSVRAFAISRRGFTVILPGRGCLVSCRGAPFVIL